MTAEVRLKAGEAWVFRTRVEQEAAARFTRLLSAIAAFDPDSPVPELMRRAAEDEKRHADLCAALAAGYGSGAPPAGADAPIAPRRLLPREAVLYEVVAACCITETESVATVTTLLAADAEPRVREVLHEIARDEVGHSRMGWAHLAREAAQIDVSFLSAWIPAMLSGTVDDALFRAAPPEPSELLRHGILSSAQRRETFVRTLEEVVLPGFAGHGIDTAPARAWLAARAS